MNAGKSTENATSVPTLANVSGLSLGDDTAIDESDLFGALSESEDDEPQVSRQFYIGAKKNILVNGICGGIYFKVVH